MKRKHHIKNFQANQYKKADARIYDAGFLAWFVWNCPVKVTLGSFDREFKRYQII